VHESARYSGTPRRYSTCSATPITVNYNAQVNSATFGQPVQTSANSYLPRAAQFAFKVAF
jgi:hypothetical protein